VWELLASLFTTAAKNGGRRWTAAISPLKMEDEDPLAQLYTAF